MPKPIATLVIDSTGKTRHQLHARYRRMLNNVADVFKFFAELGDQHAQCLGENVEKFAARYSPPAKIAGKPKDGRDRQLPVGDRVEQTSKQRSER